MPIHPRSTGQTIGHPSAYSLSDSPAPRLSSQFNAGAYDALTPIWHICLTFSIMYIIAFFESETNGESGEHYSHIHNAQGPIHENELSTGINQKNNLNPLIILCLWRHSVSQIIIIIIIFNLTTCSKPPKWSV